MQSELTAEQKKIVEQVNKLLALSKSANEFEAALALGKAEELLEKYRLDMTAIEMMTGNKEEIIEDKDPLVDSDDILQWESRLAGGIAFLYGCTTIRFSGRIIRVVGRPSDIMLVRFMVSYITLELYRLSATTLYRKGKAYKDSWFLGAVETIIQRIKESKEQTQTAFANPYAVVTVNNRYEESMTKLKEIHPDIVFCDVKPKRKVDTDAYYRGRVAGKNIKLTQDHKISNKPTLS